MKPVRTLLLLITLFLFSNCKNEISRDTAVWHDVFPKKVYLKNATIQEIRDDINPMQIGLKDSILVICDIYSDVHFYIYKLPEFNYLGSFGHQGRGPNDLLDPVFWGQFENSSSNYKIWTYQTNKMTFSFIDIFKQINSQKKNFDKNIVMPPEIGSSVNIIALSNNTFIGSGRTDNGEFFIYNDKSKKIKWLPFLIDKNKSYLEKLKKNNLLKSFKQGIIKVKPDRSMFVKIYGYMPVVDIYDNKAKLLRSVVMKNYKFPEIKQKKFDDATKVYYTDVFLTNNFIYVLNRDCSLKELKNGNGKHIKINVFSWSGKAVLQYIIEESFGYQSPYVIDEKNHKLYIFDIKNSGNYIKVYDI